MAGALADMASGATAAGPEAAHGRAFADGGFLDDELSAADRALLGILRVGHGRFQRSFNESCSLTRNQSHGIQRRDGGLPLDQARNLARLERRDPHILGNGDFFHVSCV